MRLWEAEAVTKRSRCEELNLFNAVACLLVVLIHVLSVGITELQRDTLQAAVVFFPWKLAAYVVPGFLFTGAVKMAMGFGGNDEAFFRPYPFTEKASRAVEIHIK